MKLDLKTVPLILRIAACLVLVASGLNHQIETHVLGPGWVGGMINHSISLGLGLWLTAFTLESYLKSQGPTTP